MRILLVGVGNVGRSFLRLVGRGAEGLRKIYGLNLRILAAADRGGVALSSDGLKPDEILRIKSLKGTVAALKPYGRPGMRILDVLDELEADILIDATPTNIVDGEPSYSIIKGAFAHGINVVTVSKGALALGLPALKELAYHKGVILRFSGSVGGGLPILEFAKECTLGDRIKSIQGILNGTTNYILTRMEEGLSLSEALREAQEKGYAERDPTLDIKGYDTAAKLVILANEALNLKVTLNDVKIDGIEEVDEDWVGTAPRRDMAVRLLGIVDDELRVQPTEIPASDPLAVKYALNAISFNAENSGRHVIIGKGAGGVETATAILRDLIYIKRNLVGEVA